MSIVKEIGNTEMLDYSIYMYVCAHINNVCLLVSGSVESMPRLRKIIFSRYEEVMSKIRSFLVYFIQ